MPEDEFPETHVMPHDSQDHPSERVIDHHSEPPVTGQEFVSPHGQESGTTLAPPNSLDQISTVEPPPAAEQIKPRGIAPIWHTLLIIFAILGYSIWGAIGAQHGTTNPIAPPGSPAHTVSNGVDHAGVDHVRLIRYALTGLLEIGVVLWVAFGLHLRKVPFRSLFGNIPKGLNDITMEFLIAAAFWVCSMIVLIVFALGWLVIQTQVYKHETAKQAATSSQPQSNPSAHGRPKAEQEKPKSPEQQQTEMAKQLMELAPANGIEIAAWGVLCLIVGFSEELIFRGYMQSQGIALLRSVPTSLILTALIFGAAHGYQGMRGIFLISIYGALFGVITLIRKSLVPGMIAHSWHDFATGMALALIRSSHLLEHLPTAVK